MRKVLRRIKGKKNREKGAILIVALLVGIAMLIMTTPFLFRYSNLFRDTEKSNKELSAFNLAEAGVEKAIWEQNLGWYLPYPDGIGWVNVDGNATATIAKFIAADDVTIMGNIDLILTAPAGTAPVMRYLEATGKVPFIAGRTVDRTVRLGLEQYFDSIWDFGFFVNTTFKVGKNFSIDSYHSDDGWLEWGVGRQGHFGTNNNDENPDSWSIDVGSSSYIYGTIAAGEGTPNDQESLETVIDIPKNTKLFGEPPMTAISNEFSMPSVDVFNLPPKPMFGDDESVDISVPPDPTNRNDLRNWFDYVHPYDPEEPPITSYNPLTQPTGTTGGVGGDIVDDSSYFQGTLVLANGEDGLLTSEQSGVYTSLEMGRNSTLTVDGNVTIYVTGLLGEDNPDQGTFHIDGGDIIINEGSSLTMILGNTNFLLENNTDFNEGGKPKNLIILGTDQFSTDLNGVTMGLENNGEIRAAIYVPRVLIQGLQGDTNVDIFGAMVSNSMDFKSNIDFHYDEALGDLDFITGGLEKWKIVSWQQPYNPIVLEE